MIGKINAIIFDMDGTLISSSKVIFEGYQHALIPWGITLNKVQIESIRAKKAEKLFEDWGLNETESLKAVARMNNYCNQNAKRSEVFEGITPMLERLKKLNLPLAIWTGRNTQAAIELLRTHDLDKYFSPIVGSSCVDVNKPHPEGIIKIAQTWKIAPSTILMVGDHDHDVEAGHAAGCITARAMWRETNHTHPMNSKSDWEFKSPIDLAKMVEEHFSAEID